jgi:hypothetical protein
MKQKSKDETAVSSRLSNQWNRKRVVKISPPYQRYQNPRGRVVHRFFLLITLIIGIAGVTATLLINDHLKHHAKDEARAKAMIILERNLATHAYFTHQLKPALLADQAGGHRSGSFDPVWMSSTYAVREIEAYYQELTDTPNTYKECAINARSPLNEADAFESAFIRRLNSDPALQEFAGVREFEGTPFYVVLRRGETMQESCLRCHSTPAAAPAEMVSRYGPDRSFGRSVGEVVSAISLRIPLAAAYTEIKHLVATLSLAFAGILIVSVGMLTYSGKRWVFAPLARIRRTALDISSDPAHLGEQIEEPVGRELAELTDAFNAMSCQLRQERDQLEARVDARTEELRCANERLQREIEERKAIIDQLNTSLQEVKTLRGILPICSYCKKIRDDQGAWKMIETYIAEHSDAEFSHGICLECAKTHFPGYCHDK